MENLNKNEFVNTIGLYSFGYSEKQFEEKLGANLSQYSNKHFHLDLKYKKGDKIVIDNLTTITNRSNDLFKGFVESVKEVKFRRTTEEITAIYDVISVKGNKKIFTNIVDKGIKIAVNYAQGKKYLVHGEGVRRYFTLDGVNMPVDPNATVYIPFITTENNQRRQVFYMVNEKINILEYLTDNTMGLINGIKEKLGTDAKIGDICKEMSRLSLMKSNGVNFNVDRNRVITIPGFLDMEEGTHSDGTIAVCDELYEELFNLKKGVGLGKAAQMRVKLSGYTEKELENKNKVNGIAKGLGVAFSRNTIEDKVIELQEAGQVDNSINPKEVDVILDDNAVKQFLVDGNGEDIMTVMAFAHESEGKTSKQMLEKVFYALCEHGDKTMIEDFENYLEEIIIENVGNKIVQTFDKKDGDFRLFQNYNSNGQKIRLYKNAILEELNFNSPAVAFEKCSQLINAAAKEIDKLKFFVRGGIQNYSVTGNVFDYMFGAKELLGADEIFVNNAVDKKAAAIKYPSVFVKETVVFNVVDYCELEKRIDNLEIEDEAKEEIKTFAKAAKGIAFLPTNSKFYKFLAGLDFDGDKITLIYDKKFIKALELQEQDIFVIDTKKELGGVSCFKKNGDSVKRGCCVKMDDNRFYIDVLKGYYSQEESIGMITFYNNRIIAILIDMINKGVVTDHAKNFLAECFGKESLNYGVQDYNIDYSEDVSAVFIDKMLNTMKKSVKSYENVKQFLLDCSKGLRLAQEATIDSIKTSIYLVNRIICNSVQIKSLKAIRVKKIADTEGKNFTNLQLVRDEFKEGKIARKEYSYKENKMEEVKEELDVLFLDDVLGKIQDRAIEKINRDLKMTLLDIARDFKYDNKKIVEASYEYMKLASTTFVNEITGEKTLGRVILDNILKLKHMSIQSAIEIYNSQDLNDFEGDEVWDIIAENKQKVEKRMETFRNSTISHFYEMGLDIEDKSDRYTIGAVLFYIALLGKGRTLDENSKSNFASDMHMQSYIEFMSGETGSIEMTGKIINKIDENLIGSTVELVRGISEKVLVKENYTGAVEIIDEKTVRASYHIETEQQILDESGLIVLYGDEAMISTLYNTVNRNSALVNVNNSSPRVCFDSTQDEMIFHNVSVGEYYNDMKGYGEDVPMYVESSFMSNVFIENYNMKQGYSQVPALVLFVQAAEEVQ